MPLDAVAGLTPDPPSPFDDRDDGDLRRLIDEYPLAWICSASGSEASLLPLVGVYDEEDRLVELIGHCARSSPLVAAFAEDPRALILFTGPHRYISPALAGCRDWAPTWNFVQARIRADVVIDPGFTAVAVDRLIERMESEADVPWSMAELGARGNLLLAHVVGFRARVTASCGRFKLGQDERPDTLRKILGHLGDSALARWMRSFNQARTGD